MNNLDEQTKEMAKKISAIVNSLIGANMDIPSYRAKLKELKCPYYVHVSAAISKKLQKGRPDTRARYVKICLKEPIYYMFFYESIIDWRKKDRERSRERTNKGNKIETINYTGFSIINVSTQEIFNELKRRGFSGKLSIIKDVEL